MRVCELLQSISLLSGLLAQRVYKFENLLCGSHNRSFLKSRCFQRFSYVFIGYDTSDLFSVTTVVDTTSEEIEGTDPHHEGWQFPSLGWKPPSMEKPMRCRFQTSMAIPPVEDQQVQARVQEESIQKELLGNRWWDEPCMGCEDTGTLVSVVVNKLDFLIKRYSGGSLLLPWFLAILANPICIKVGRKNMCFAWNCRLQRLSASCEQTTQ